MSSTTPKAKAASPSVKTPAQIQKGSGGGTPVIQPNSFEGFQEHVPDAVFLSTAGGQAFLESAKNFYTYFGLQPKDIKSIEELVNLLANPANTTVYKRLLIVSHAHPRGMIIPFFTGGVVGTNKELFSEFAKSDLDGLILLNPFDPPVFKWDDVFTAIMSKIRSTAARADKLDPFGIKTNGMPPGLLKTFFEECFTFVFVKTPGHVKNKFNNIISAAERKIFTDYLKELSDQRKKNLENTTINGNVVNSQHLNDLQTMLMGLTLTDLSVGSVYKMSHYIPTDVNYFPTLEKVVPAVKNGFHNKIVKMRTRFTSTSVIDIRGCRAGEEPEYLTALREFFDKPGSPQLKATAPRWFQSYPPLAWQMPQNRNDIKSFLSGRIFLNTVGHDEQMKGAKSWAAMIKVDPLHTDFWLKIFGGTPTTFTSLAWRNTIPPLFIPTPGLTAMTGLSLPDVIKKIADMFNVPAASVPSASQIAANDTVAIQTFMNAAKESLEIGDAIYYYMLFAGLPIFFYNKYEFQNHEGLLVLKTFEHDAMQTWYKCMWNGTLPANASNASTTAKINNEISRRVPMLQDDRTANQFAICPAAEYGYQIQTSP